MSETITISVDEQVSKKFRRLASLKYGRRKGSLSKAVNEALSIWNKSAESDPNAEALRLMHKGFHLGGLKIKSRDELHER